MASQKRTQNASQKSPHRKGSKAALEWLRKQVHRYEKGSDERNAAYKAWKVAQVKMLRRRPGARKKGVPVKATDAQSRKAKEKPVEAPARRLSAEEAKRLERATVLEVIDWVMRNLGEDKCPIGADGKAKLLWRFGKDDPQGFMNTYLPMLLKAEQAKKKAEVVDHAAKTSIELLEQWLENFWKANPEGDSVHSASKSKEPPVAGNGQVSTSAKVAISEPSTNGHQPAITVPPMPVAAILPAPPVPKQPTLCAHCRQYGYALHQECELANNPELKLENGILWRTLHP